MMNFPKIKTLHETESFQLLDCGGMVGIKPLFTNVVVMPFTSDDQGLPLAVGVLKEPNPFREDGHHISLVTGTTDDEDGDLLSTAQRELRLKTLEMQSQNLLELHSTNLRKPARLKQ